MKRIIELSENDYMALKEDGVQNHLTLADTIIDHSVIYEERSQDCSDCKRYDSPYFEVKFDKEQMQELVDKAKAEVLASIERSQSEWVGNAFDEHYCKRCGHPALWEEESDGQYYEVRSNFCPNCGEKMKGGSE